MTGEARDGALFEASGLERSDQGESVPSGAVTVAGQDLADREHGRGAPGPVALDERAVASVAGDVGAEVWDGDADRASGDEGPVDVLEDPECVSGGEVLQDVLEKGSVNCSGREGQSVA